MVCAVEHPASLVSSPKDRPSPARMGRSLADQSGETYRTDEFGFTLTRQYGLVTANSETGERGAVLVRFESFPPKRDRMPVTININGLSLVHKGSNGMATATMPDVCKTPSPAGPVPIPYPNIAMSKDLVKGTTSITVDGGNMAANAGSELMLSTGDEAGTAGGVASSSFIK